MPDVPESPDPADRAGPGAPAPDDPAPPNDPAPRRRQGMALRRTSRWLVAAVAAMVFAVTGAGWGATQWLDRTMHEVLALDPDSASITDAGAQHGDENILLVGSDTREGAESTDHVGDPSVVGGARSDTVMIAHLSADRSRAVIVSFPRDLQIQRPECRVWDPATRTYSDRTDPGAPVAKLNTAYQIGGPLCVTKVVQQLSGLAVTRFVGIDFHGFKALVDALGGVSVCVERPLTDEALGTIIPEPGYHRITGDTALNFVRARHVDGDPTSDYGRIARQQRFLSALLRQVLSPTVLLNPARLSPVVNAVAANTVGENIGTRELLDLSRSLEGLDPSKVLFVTVPTTGDANDHGNEELRMRDSAALFRAVIDGTPLPGEHRPPDPRPPDPRPAGDGAGEDPAGFGQAHPFPAQQPFPTPPLPQPPFPAPQHPPPPHPLPEHPFPTPPSLAEPEAPPEPHPGPEPVAPPLADPRTTDRLGGTGTAPAPATAPASEPPADGAPLDAGEPDAAPAAEGGAAPDSGPAGGASTDFPVSVLNGSGVAGSAGSTAQALRETGFTVSEVGDAPERVAATVLRYPPERRHEALTLLAAVPDAVLQPDQTLTDGMVLMVGPGFEGVVPSTPGGPAPAPEPGPLETVNGADDTCS